MATKVFISWSGDLSQKLGKALSDWLPAALQYVKPYFSPDDIEKGAKWNSEIATELGTSNIGIICLTQNNTEKPWILFESGALSKSLDRARVCTLLFNLDPTDVKGPLTSFQATKFVRDDFKRLFTTINNNAGDSKLDSPVLDNVFDKWWPELEEQVAEILKTHGSNGPMKAQRPDRDIIEEILELTRMNAERAHMRSQINPLVVKNLIEEITELMSFTARKPDDISLSIIHRVDRSIKHLCHETGFLSLYDHFHKNIRVLMYNCLPMRDKMDDKEEPELNDTKQLF